MLASMMFSSLQSGESPKLLSVVMDWWCSNGSCCIWGWEIGIDSHLLLSLIGFENPSLITKASLNSCLWVAYLKGVGRDRLETMRLATGQELVQGAATGYHLGSSFKLLEALLLFDVLPNKMGFIWMELREDFTKRKEKFVELKKTRQKWPELAFPIFWVVAVQTTWTALLNSLR